MRLAACGSCDRHILDKEAVCPFCGGVQQAPDDEVPHHGGRLAHALATMCAGMLFACAPNDPDAPEGAGSTGAADTGDPGMGSVSATGPGMTTLATTTAPPDPGGSSGDPPSVTTGEDATDEGTDWDDAGDGPAGFYAGPPPDGGGVSVECDLFAQDCPEDEKCMPWANDGGGAWNATRCTPLAADPVQLGDPCSVEGSGVSGLDNCDIAHMCWDVDDETNIGTCVAMCTGDESNPICEDPDTTCAIANDAVIVLCLPTCDPLLQDCEEGLGCYPIGDDFVCAPDVSGEMGLPGDPCEFINTCGPSTFCLGAAAVTNCDAAGCCVPVCDHTDEEADAFCADFDAGTQCEPWYEAGEAPPDYENVGVCVTG